MFIEQIATKKPVLVKHVTGLNGYLCVINMRFLFSLNNLLSMLLS